ncbi:T9SS type A sorting domain-containing protein [Hymenobacter sp.]|jgi:hypothetical protein|uniref:T9SS type A sorting domain-containing protein n=1 Tax=Hymenobacter sp. TaxID=1898978 RepID=UPI002EDAD075
MKKTLLSCLVGWLLAVPATYAQTQTPTRAVKLLLGKGESQHTHLASVYNAHRGTATITLPGRSTGRSWNSTANRWNTSGAVSTYSYDSRGNNTQVVYSDSATAMPEGKEFYTYNSRNQVTEYSDQNWNGSAYVNDEREQYTYDAQGNNTLQVRQTWNGTAWVTQSSYRTTYTYNTANVVTSRVYEQLNMSNNIWEQDGRITFTVNANNQWTEAVYQEWNNGAYVNDERTRNITWYDWGKLLPSYYEDQEWSGGAWVDDQRSTITYQPNGSYVEVQQQPTAPNMWVNDDRITTTYDNFGNLILDQTESWNNNAWTITSADRTVLSYTATNEVRRAVEQEYNTSLGRYVNSYLTTYGSFVTLATRRATGLEAAATLHPNPTAGTATISLSGLREQGTLPAEVLNVVGQVVQTMALRPQQGSIKQEINLTTLPAGVYTVRVHTSDGAVTKRVVKQ